MNLFAPRERVPLGPVLLAVSLASGCGDSARDGGERGEQPHGEGEPLTPLGSDDAPAGAASGTPLEESVPRDVLLSESALSRVYHLIEADLAELSEESRRFARYVWVSEASAEGIPTYDVDRARWALFEAVNTVSSAETLVVPDAVDAERTVYRLDLRAYGWDAPLDARHGEDWLQRAETDPNEINAYPGGCGAFVPSEPRRWQDAWQAMTALSGSAVALSGSVAARVASQTTSDAPVMRAATLVYAATHEWLYSSLLGLPNSLSTETPSRGTGSEDLRELEAALGVVQSASETCSEGESLPDSGVTGACTGLRGSPAGNRSDFHERLPECSAQSGGAERVLTADSAPYWRTIDYYCCADGIYDDPLSDGEANLTSITPMKNGLYAFVSIANEPAGSACLSCHAHGPEPFDDHLRQFVLDREFLFNEADVELVSKVYPLNDELGSAIEADQARHVQALTALGIPAGEAPLSWALRRFTTPLNASAAATELGITTEQLRGTLIGRALAENADGQLSRREFEQRYRSVLCQLRGDTELLASGCGVASRGW